MSASKSQIDSFIRTMAPIAVRQAERHGNRLFPSICIAQACHESGFGTSKKMIDANAVFGIKVGRSAYRFGSAWKGEAYKTGTTEYYDGKTATKIQDWFRAYDSLGDATEDYMDLLCNAKRYKGALYCKTPEESIKGIVAGGYATGPKYAENIMKHVRTYHLDRFDPGYKVEYFPKYEGTSDSIIDALTEVGAQSTKEYRKMVYNANFFDTYRYSAKQNTAMLILLKQGILIKP